MAVVAFILSLALASSQEPQAPDPRLTTALSKAEQQKLNGLAKEWFSTQRQYDGEEDPQRRTKMNKDLRLAKEKFMKEWRSREKKEPIKHVGDLLAVFDNVFEYRKQSVTAELKAFSPKESQPYSVLAPKGYKETERYPTVLLLPSRGEAKWVTDKEHMAATWKGAESHTEWLFVIPKLAEGLELDPAVDLTTDAGQGIEIDRIKAVLAAAGDAQRDFHVDRNRLILDCGKGASGYGLRIATYFPSRFAGLILRHPVDPGELRLDGLVGTKVLLVASEETKAAADKIEQALNGLENATCSTFDAADADLANKIAGWAKERRRDLFRRKVTVAPNNDLFKKSAWVEIDRAEVLATAPKDQKPYLQAEADREANRVTITARGVSTFVLLLNDALLDLDKEVSFVVNGKASTHRLQRSFTVLEDWLLGKNIFDPNYIWTVVHAETVPKAEATKTEKPDGAADGPGK